MFSGEIRLASDSDCSELGVAEVLWEADVVEIRTLGDEGYFGFGSVVLLADCVFFVFLYCVATSRTFSFLPSSSST